MIPTQTSQVLVGTITAFLYASAIIAFGTSALRIAITARTKATICDHLGLSGFVWLGFVTGQGVISLAWLALSLAGLFHPWIILLFSVAGSLLACAMVLGNQRHLIQSLQKLWARLASFLASCGWYRFVAGGVLVVVILSGAMALLPTGIDDALRWYLVLPKVIATQHRLELLPFLSPYYGLHPLQVEMHWGALFSISNETAVTVWDYLCAFSSLMGIAFLAWALTASSRVAMITVLMMLSTPGFYDLIGGGKPDNAAAQYGIAAFLWLVLLPVAGRRAIVMAGISSGWMIAARYTNFILIPALAIFAFIVVHRAAKSAPANTIVGRLKKSWPTASVLGIVAATLGGAPMLIKNWVLSGCPLALVVPCQQTFLRGPTWIKGSLSISNQKSLSILDLLSYPITWTFGDPSNLLGNISPLFIGFVPFLILYYRSRLVRSGLVTGLTAFVAIVTWWLIINGLFPHTRWILVPLALLAIPLSASVVAAEQDLGAVRITRWLIRGAIFTVLLFLLFQSRGFVYAVRYATAKDDRTASYQAKPGYDVAIWLNNNMHLGQRVAFAGWNGFSYFIQPVHLMNSESLNEFARLWQLCGCSAPLSWTADFWRFYAERGFTYVLVRRELVDNALSVSPPNIRVQIAFLGNKDAVLRIATPEKPQQIAIDKTSGRTAVSNSQQF